MSVLVIIGVLAAGLVNLAFLVLGILSFCKAKKLDKKIDHLTDKLVSNDMLKGGMKAAATDREVRTQEIKEEMARLHQLMESADVARHKKLIDKMNSVEAHMALYSSVLESQNRLINGVNELIETLEDGGRRHR